MEPQTWIETIASILNSFAVILIYFVIGFGPGFIVGVLLANKFSGKNHPLRMEKQNQNIQKAAEHNSQWHPNNPKWQ
ncbi:MAG: hypothetical protein A3C02_00425 [Candidatus Andersenbacteria bacterium RIFCSPHIGHO2_02_FULL_45_11]|uniref:Uncharacterized protein n=1 Tax=Candidatus Andersenbacteria bacterium RIFCSPHIGHO2_12_FULL_45_11 TaxID=1797281 RepID=A0A1G1X1I8_9BACT|nr:MAG: hypothetical protein A2805_04055 [Candidatus Andersenbacteria bacterium RIFCSPHIGHO2_01_FULL_46_36]OGY33683.1 MAG: hypothetical protein A3C02_00425 [Candidatus Andersenbacteria bacterium RIFCSPHIGHO2_02_FULL_45_11]OGY33868.1 MAG: hypothetical protein A3D99_03985 [Candidatus Andersenbacteria bacterium RIFCSPHIGHO2_12_FULL_45_11]